MALILSTCRVVEQLWDNVCEGLRLYLHNKSQLFSMLSFSWLIMLLSRWYVEFVCSVCLPSYFSWHLHLPLPSSERFFPALQGLEGLSVTMPAHAGYKGGLWFIVIQLKAYLEFPKGSWSQVLLLLWIKSSKDVTTKLSRVTFMWHTCKGARETLKPIHGQLSKGKIYLSPV